MTLNLLACPTKAAPVLLYMVRLASLGVHLVSQPL